MFLFFYTIYESNPGHIILVISSSQSSHHHGHLVLVVVVISLSWSKHKTVQAAQTITFYFQMFLFYYPIHHGCLLLDTLYAYPDASSLLSMSCHGHLQNLVVIILQLLSQCHLIVVIILSLFYHHLIIILLSLSSSSLHCLPHLIIVTLTMLSFFCLHLIIVLSSLPVISSSWSHLPSLWLGGGTACLTHL